jgi:hypothetical protein
MTSKSCLHQPCRQTYFGLRCLQVCQVEVQARRTARILAGQMNILRSAWSRSAGLPVFDTVAWSLSAGDLLRAAEVLAFVIGIPAVTEC